jgi:hypothetical protein
MRKSWAQNAQIGGQKVDLRRLLWVGVVLMVGAVTLTAAGSGDVFGQVGLVSVSKEVDTVSGRITLASVGGGGSGMIGDKAAVFGEFNYIPVFSGRASDNSMSAKAIQAGAGVRVFIPTGNSNVKLYIPATGGLVRISASEGSDSGSASISRTGGYFGFGLGSEIGEKFGVRPEFRYTRYQVSGVGVNGISVSASIFYRFGGK